jgi:hypothetical protein
MKSSRGISLELFVFRRILRLKRHILAPK